MNSTLKLRGIDINSRRSASACAATSRKGLLRWLISMTDVPPPCQSSNSSRACCKTSSGSTAGPGEKLKARTAEILWIVGSRIGKLGFPVLILARQALDAFQAGELIALLQPDQSDTLGIAADHGNVLNRRTHQHAVLAHQHDLIVHAHLQRAHHDSVAVGNLQRNHTLTAAAVLREILERREFAESVLRRRENEAVLLR